MPVLTAFRTGVRLPSPPPFDPQQITLLGVSFYPPATYHQLTTRVSKIPMNKHRKAIETRLRGKSQDLSSLNRSVILYEVTNTHFEGVCAKNPKAKHGKNKPQRNACRQIQVAVGMAFDRKRLCPRPRSLRGQQGGHQNPPPHPTPRVRLLLFDQSHPWQPSKRCRHIFISTATVRGRASHRGSASRASRMGGGVLLRWKRRGRISAPHGAELPALRVQANNSLTTRAGSTPVRRWSRPWNLKLRRSCCMPRACSKVA